MRDNGGVKEYGVLLTFTLKAFPKFSFDLNFDPGSAPGQTDDQPNDCTAVSSVAVAAAGSAS